VNDATTATLTVFAFVVGILWLVAAIFKKEDREGNALIAICFFLIAILVSQ
jgi:uncharacterized membrane protein YoaK (UPF0700 family)